MFKPLPTLDFLFDKFQAVDLQGTALIVCQHILQSTAILFEYFLKLGLPSEKLFVLGKAYSTNREVVDYLLKMGIYIHPHSYSFDSHQSWDLQFKEYVKDFLTGVFSKIKEDPSIKKIIVIDDGSELTRYINEMEDIGEICFIEWTSSGYRKLLNFNLKYPVLNMARAQSKLALESKIIGAGVVDKISSQYKNIVNDSLKALVIGAGPIGLAVKKSLEALKKKVEIIDIETSLNTLNGSEFDLIVGCTGETVFGINDLENFKGATLVSASSSDREFSAFLIRQNFLRNTDPHHHYSSEGICLANSGFPINFDGSMQFLPLEAIQLTLALAFAGVCLSVLNFYPSGLNHFPSEIDKEITQAYLSSL